MYMYAYIYIYIYICIPEDGYSDNTPNLPTSIIPPDIA